MTTGTDRPWTADEQATAAARLVSRDGDRWAKQAAGCGHCARPVRLFGNSTTVDTRTGEVLAVYDSRSEPDGLTYVRCGNRRAAICPSCSREYQGDMWHLIVAGTAGGKGVPATVSSHPLVFATLTAPSFGLVHAHKKPGNGSRRCRPRTRKELCPHGRPTWCMAIHDETDGQAGQPLCLDCYDHLAHVVWQWHAPELWRRFTITLRRQLATRLGLSETAARKLVRVQFAKVAEFQRRGLVHFHALLRLDGPPDDDHPCPAPSCGLTSEMLAELVHASAALVSVTADPALPADVARLLRFGVQVDARPVRTTTLDGDELTAQAVAGYIAKYATKATEDADPGSRSNPHIRTLRRTIDQVATHAASDPDSAYHRLRLWDGMLGFRGHFATKSRAYSTTLGRLRGARRDWQRRQQQARRRGDTPPVETGLTDPDDDETTLVIGNWRYAGMGWLTTGDAALAAMAADAARERAQERAKQRV